MIDDTRHFDEELSEFVDDRLDSATRAAIEAHLAACRLCRERLDNLRWLKASLAAGAEAPVPQDLRARIGRTLDAEDRRTRRSRWTSAPMLIAASLVLAAGAILFVTRAPRVPDVETVANDFRAVRTGALSLGLQTASPAELETFFARGGLPFPARVFDFGMMNYTLAGGLVHQQAGRPTALYSYRARSGSTGDLLVCQMFPGAIGELPAPDTIRHHDGIAFHVFTRGELTLVFWQEGEIVCVLTGAGDVETLLQFAFAKAIKV